jgi:3-hydroxybutyrate dehydrogenase
VAQTKRKNTGARSLVGIHAVVTGGGRGIGFAVAEELLRRGAVVTLMGRDRARLGAAKRKLARRGVVETEVVDVGSERAVRKAFKRAVKRQGHVGVLINNAGAAESAPLVRSSTALWERMLGVNLTGVFLCSREVVGGMLKLGRGSIVTIASTAGIEGYPYVSAYCAAKHGAVGFSRALALELKGSGITVNTVCPHFTETDLLADSVRNVAQMTGQKPAAIRASYLRSMPHGRFVKPTEVSAVVAQVCERSEVTGRAIVVDGGKVKL